MTTGGLAGLATGYVTGSTGAGVAAGVAVTGISWLASELVKDKTYSMITDIQVSVRVAGNGIEQTTHSSLSQGGRRKYSKIILKKRTGYIIGHVLFQWRIK